MDEIILGLVLREHRFLEKCCSYSPFVSMSDFLVGMLTITQPSGAKIVENRLFRYFSTDLILLAGIFCSCWPIDAHHEGHSFPSAAGFQLNCPSSSPLEIRTMFDASK